MISSFFNKTKPVNYIILAVFLLLFYGLYVSHAHSLQVWSEQPVIEALAIIALVLQIFVISEITRTEKITEFSSFSMLFFSLFLFAFPDSILDKNAIFSNLFLLLALWRLLSIKSMKNVKHKIFDASFFIGISSLFYDWTLLYLILVFLVINVFEGNNLKNWIVPFVAIFSSAILAFTILSLTGSLSFLSDHYTFRLGFEKETFAVLVKIKPMIFVFLSVILIILVFLKLRKKGGGKLVALRILSFAFLLSILVSVLKIESSGGLLLAFFPIAVFLTNYVETVKSVKFKEIWVSLFIVSSLLIFVIQITS